MDTQNITNEIKFLHDVFINKIQQINSYKNHIEDETKKYIQDLEKQAQQIENNTYLDIDEEIRLCRLSYFDIMREKLINPKFTAHTIEGLYDLALSHHNRQYQWLLVEAYELYAKFLKDLYALIGFYDNDFWRASDFGDISIDEIKSKSKEWFKESIINQKTYLIEEQFRKKLKLMSNYETGKAIVINGITAYRDPHIEKKNYQVYLKMITKFRNHIVHDKGEVLDRDKFLKSIVKNKAEIEDFRINLDAFFGLNKYENMICLIEIEDPVSSSFGKHTYHRLSTLLQIISSHATLICDLSIILFRDKNV